MRPGWEIDDHDLQVSVYVRDTDTIQAILMDPDFQALVADDHEYSLQDKAKVTAGWEEVFLEDGKIVEVDQATTYEQRAKIGSNSQALPVENADKLII